MKRKIYLNINDGKQCLLKKLNEDMLLYELRELLTENIKEEFFFIKKNTEGANKICRINKYEEKFLSLKKIIDAEDTIYIKTTINKIKLLLEGDDFEEINCGENINLNDLRKLSKNMNYNLIFVDKDYEIAQKEEKDFKVKDIISDDRNINIKIKNCITVDIEITEENVGKNIDIVNSSYKEIIENFIIKINNVKLPSFSYKQIFKKKGKIKIQYLLKNILFNMSYMFSECYSLKDINLSNFNAKNVTNMEHMFSGCCSLTSINLSNFNIQNVTYMQCMFSRCSSLKDINLSNFNTQNVTNMCYMFSECKSLTSINLSNFNTQNVTNMQGMFFGCSSLKDINLSNFNTQNVTDMKSMFCGCSSLTSINLSNFNTQNVTNMQSMFFGCSSLTSINLSNFNAKNVTDMSCMFDGCSSLTKEKIIVSDYRIKNNFN